MRDFISRHYVVFALTWILAYIFAFNTLKSFAEDPFLQREMENTQSVQDGDQTNSGSKEELSQKAGEGGESQESVKSKKKPAFPGYGLFRENLLVFCKQLNADGQSQRFQASLDKLLIERGDCSTCRQFYRAFSCKSSPKQTGTPKPKATEPSTELLASLSEIFNKIAAIPELVGPTAESLTPLLMALAAHQDAASDAYFDIFAAYIRAPLVKELGLSDKKEAKQKEKIKKKQLEALF